MPVPDFTPDDRFPVSDGYPYPVLPEGVHDCTETEFSDRFVGGFSVNGRREEILQGFLRLRRTAKAADLFAVQWVDGSFVEAKPEPGDVDVVSFVSADRLNSLDEAAQDTAANLLDGHERTKPQFQTHTFLVPHAAPGHSYHAVYEAARLYWRKWLGHTREYMPAGGGPLRKAPKGLIRLNLGNAGDLPDVSEAPDPGTPS